MALTEKEILDALSKVQDPELKRDIVSLGMVRDLRIDGGCVSFALALTTPKCPMKNRMADDARKALSEVAGIESVEIRFSEMDDAGKARIGTCLPKEGQNQDAARMERLKNIKRIVSVASGKGGVGKSTIAVNVAAGLASDGHTVGILDADIYGPSIPMMLKISEQPEVTDGKIQPVIRYGIKAISMGMFVNPGEAVIWRGPMVMKAIQQFIDDVEWGELDYLIIDFPPGTGDAQLSIAQLIRTSGAVIVTTPQNLAFVDVTRAIAMFEKVKVPILGIVENMSYFKCPHCGEETEIFHKGSQYLESQNIGYPILARFPIDTELPITGDNGMPIVLSNPQSETAIRLQNLARKIHGMIEGK